MAATAGIETLGAFDPCCTMVPPIGRPSPDDIERRTLIVDAPVARFNEIRRESPENA